MHYPAHANIFRGAVKAQTPEIQGILAPYSGLFDDAGNYPDIFDNPTLPESEKDLIDPDWRRFCLYPETFAGRTMHSWPFPKEQQINHLPMLKYLFANAVDCYAEGDIAGTIKFVGCMSHYLGDITQPAHLLDQRLMEQLLPPPPGHEAFHYHWTLEQVVGECPPLSAPELLGGTIDEACWRLMEFHQRSINEARAYIVPTVQALFRDDMDEAVRLATRPVEIAAEGTRDILATVIAIGSGTVDEPITEFVDLRTWFPESQMHPIAYGRAFVDQSKTTGPLDGPVVPALLLDDLGEKVEVEGLGVIGRSTMTWCYPAGLLSRFEVSIGMHADLATQGAGVFVVELDDVEVFRSDPIVATAPPLSISIPLEASTKLSITMLDPSKGITYYHNHAIWQNPRLYR